MGGAAAKTAQHAELLDGRDAFRQRLDPHVVAHTDDRAQARQRVSVLQHGRDEAAVDLDPVKG